MLIENTKQRIARAFDKRGQAVLLLPGVNQLSAKVWAELKANKHFAKSIARGDFKVLSEDEAKPGETPIGPSIFKNVRTAVDTIRATFDPALLNQWKQGEARTTITEAIDAQLALLEKNKKEMKESAKARAEQKGATEGGDDSAGDDEGDEGDEE